MKTMKYCCSSAPTLTAGVLLAALEYNETLEDALKREVYEETGLIIKNPELFRTYSGPDFFQIYPNGDQVHGVLVVYICREFHGELVCDQTESKELRFFPLDELPSTLHPVIEGFFAIFITQLKIKIKQPHLPS